MLLGQGRVEKFLLDCAEETGGCAAHLSWGSPLTACHHSAGVRVERLTVPTGFTFDGSASVSSEYPISITMERLPPPRPKTEDELRSGLYRSNMFADGSASSQAGKQDEMQAGVGKTMAEEPRPTTASDSHGSPGATEVVRAKYVVGCDGARSWVRKWVVLHLFLPLSAADPIRSTGRLATNSRAIRPMSTGAWWMLTR